jgi:hypothetical protein
MIVVLSGLEQSAYFLSPYDHPACMGLPWRRSEGGGQGMDVDAQEIEYGVNRL